MNRLMGVLITGGLICGCGPLLKGDRAKLVVQDEPTPALQEEHLENPKELPSPTEGHGIAVIHAPERAARVSLVLSAQATALKVNAQLISRTGTEKVALQTRLLCAETPCAVSLPIGASSIVFEAPDSGGYSSRRDIVDLTITREQQRITHYMSRSKSVVEPRNLLPAALELPGWGALYLGGVTTAKGLFENEYN